MNTDKVISQYSRKVEIPSTIIELVQLVLGGLCLLAIPICGAFLVSSMTVTY